MNDMGSYLSHIAGNRSELPPERFHVARSSSSSSASQSSNVGDRVRVRSAEMQSSQHERFPGELEEARRILEDSSTHAIDRIDGHDRELACEIMQHLTEAFNGMHTRLEAAALRRDDSPRGYEESRVNEPAALRTPYHEVGVHANSDDHEPERAEDHDRKARSMRKTAYGLITSPAGRAALYPMYQAAVGLYKVDKAAASAHPQAPHSRSALKKNLLYALNPELIDVFIELHERTLTPPQN